MTEILLGWCDKCSEKLFSGQAYGLASCKALALDEIKGDIFCQPCHAKIYKGNQEEDFVDDDETVEEIEF